MCPGWDPVSRIFLREDCSLLVSKQSSVIGLLFPVGQSSCWWAVCQADQLHLPSGISENKRNCGTRAVGVWVMALTTRQYEADAS